MTSSAELTDLTRHIPARLIENAPQGKSGHYVPHFVIVQALLALGRPFDWELVEILRGRVEGSTTKTGTTYPPLESAVVGAVYRLRIEIDGRMTVIEEAGSCEAGAWDSNDGERLKKAASDAMKRCAMRLGVALHLWCKRPDQFFIHRLLVEGAKPEDDGPVAIGGEGDDEIMAAPGSEEEICNDPDPEDPGRPFEDSPSGTPSGTSPEPDSTTTTSEAEATIHEMFPGSTTLTSDQQAEDEASLWNELYALTGDTGWVDQGTVGVLKANTKRIYHLAALLSVWPPDAYVRGVGVFAANDPEVSADSRVVQPVRGMSGLKVKGFMARFAGQTVGWMRNELAKRTEED